METLIIYLVKSSAIALLFLMVYFIFLRKETFFASNRLYLVFGLLISLTLPMASITKTVWIEAQPLAQGVPVETFEILAPPEETAFDWLPILLLLYTLGVVFFLSQLLVQLYSIKKIKANSRVIKKSDLKHVQSETELAPFSFFKHIFYCPAQFKDEELRAILAHEAVHAKQYHSLDVLFMQLVCIALWFNPLVWVYKKFAKQNLEFLADAVAVRSVTNKKEYQYTLLRQAMGTKQLAIINPFFNSLTKKRITMLHQHPSKKRSLLKLLTVLPFLAFFISAFTLRTEYKTTPLPEHKGSISFENGTEKSTGNGRQEGIKEGVIVKGYEFSKTAETNENDEGINPQLRNKGKETKNESLALSYTTTSSPPIPSLSLAANKKEAFAATYDDFSPQDPNAKSANKSDITSRFVIKVDKNTTSSTLKKEAGLLGQKGVTVNFKGIRRNASGEITSIKVTYDNGAGSKGTYQQKRTDTISAFKIIVTINEDEPAQIKVIAEDKQVYSANSKTKIMMESLEEIGEDDDIIIKRKGRKHKVMQINSGDSHSTFWSDDNDGIIIDARSEKVFVNGEEYSMEELKKMGYDIRLDTDEDKDSSSVYLFSEDNSGITIKKHGSGDDVLIEIDSIRISKGENTVKLDLGDSEDFKIKFKKGSKRPLVIVDGVEVDGMPDLDQEDIETMTVLKNEAAEKKYGKKGKNGVVEITTKKQE